MTNKIKITKQLLEMRVGSTRVICLPDPKKLQSVASTATRLKNENSGSWSVRKDYKNVAVSVTRIS